MRYILYARKSSESEDRQVQSIDDQVRILREMAATRGLTIVEEISESHSAKDPGARAGFETMVKKIEKGHADAILCWAINRLTRNPVDSGKLSWMLQSGTLLSIHTPDRQFLPSDNVLLFAVETGTANQFILDLKKSVKRGTLSKVEKGWAPFRAPEGYLNDTYEHTIQPDPERFETIQRAWKLLISGSHTIAEVHRILNEEWGFTTRRRHKSGGGKLSRTSAYDLFTNPFYAGFFLFRGEMHPGNHKPMITYAEYEQAQKHIRGTTMKRRSSRHDFPYAGLLHCARCGGGVTAETQKGRHGIGSYIYYHCARTAGECSKRGIREETLELEIDRHLSGLSITKEMGELVRDALRDWAKAEFAGLDGVYEEQTKTLVESERRLSGLLDLRLAGVIDTATYQTKEAELKGIVSRLRGEVSKVQGQVDQTRETVENAIAFCETAHVRFQLGGLFERREVARLLGIRYSLLDGKVEVKPNPIFLHLHRVFAPISENIEPLKTGSESKKRTAPEGAVLHGWATRTKIEILSSVFQSVRDENLTFTRPSWLIAH
ncbi:recombinase family protein [Armatimonas sp.]|uniref:recombinase family protein n=1 Tax=Armatimonas sp. TaxID=1872638 RepID=UPI00374D56B9